MVTSCGVRNSTGPVPSVPNDFTNLPSGVNLEIRATVAGVAVGCCPLCPSAMKISPFGATTMLVGSVSASGGLPATPGLPMVSNTLPSGLNLTTV